MTAVLTGLAVYAALATVATLACAVLAWRHWRAGAPDPDGLDAAVQSLSDDMDALARAVTAPRPVLNVVRLHTGALAVTYSALTVPEALDVGEQCIRAAIATSYEHTGICDAESYANGDSTL